MFVCIQKDTVMLVWEAVRGLFLSVRCACAQTAGRSDRSFTLALVLFPPLPPRLQMGERKKTLASTCCTWRIGATHPQKIICV